MKWDIYLNFFPYSFSAASFHRVSSRQKQKNNNQKTKKQNNNEQDDLFLEITKDGNPTKTLIGFETELRYVSKILKSPNERFAHSSHHY